MTKTKLMLLATVATGLLMQPVSALEAQAFVDRLTEVSKAIGYDFKFGAVTLDGDTITAQGVTVGLVGMSGDGTAGSEGMEPMVIDTPITFSGVTELPDGGYMADSVTVPDIDTDFAAEPTGHITLSDIEANGLYLPGGDTVPAVALLQVIEAFSTGPLLVTRDGADVFSYDSFESQSEFLPEHGTAALENLSSNFAINGLSVDLTSVQEEDPAAAEVIDALGLTNISGDITQNFTWSMADGHLVMDQFLFDFADVGALNIALDVTGMTPAVLDQIYAMQSQMSGAGETPTEEEAQAQMMQGMAIMQGVSIVGASVRYDDASLAGKLLDYFAAQQGADRATFVDGLKSALPAIIGQSGIPALNDAVIPAVSEFLDDPQSLEIKVAPPSPTSILVMMAAAANPAGLISALGLAVEANQAAQ